MRSTVFSLLLASTCLFGAEVPKKAIADPFCLVTIAKSGSHLMQKTLFLLSGWKGYWPNSKPLPFSTLERDLRYPWTHFLVNSSLELYFSKMKKIVMIRDPRDICISMVYMILSDLQARQDSYPAWGKRFPHLSFDKQLLGVISGKYVPQAKDLQLNWNIQATFLQAIDWIHLPETLVCHYEDLVGEKGGGSQTSQVTEVMRIANFLGLSVPQEEISHIASLLYGDEQTFDLETNYREGKIQAWKSAFKENHKIAFKKRFGSCLVALGYELDDQW